MVKYNVTYMLCGDSHLELFKSILTQSICILLHMHYPHHKLTDVMKVSLSIRYSCITQYAIYRIIYVITHTWIKFITRLIILLLDGRLNQICPGTFFCISVTCRFRAKCKNINKATFFFFYLEYKIITFTSAMNIHSYFH